MEEYRVSIRSAALKNERHLWVKAPVDRTECDTVIVFLDAEFYRDRVFAPKIIDDLRAKGLIRASWTVYVSHLNLDARWLECPCYDPFASFVAEEVWQKLETEFGLFPLSRRVLVGLSYTGLAASYIALRFPERFSTVISQSGSYWWNDEWLSGEFAALRPAPSARFFLDVGSQETASEVSHRPDVHQKISQISGVRRFRDVLSDLGFFVQYREFNGGHEMSGWAGSLPHLLVEAVPSRSISTP